MSHVVNLHEFFNLHAEKQHLDAWVLKDCPQGSPKLVNMICMIGWIQSEVKQHPQRILQVTWKTWILTIGVAVNTSGDISSRH